MRNCGATPQTWGSTLPFGPRSKSRSSPRRTRPKTCCSGRAVARAIGKYERLAYERDDRDHANLGQYHFDPTAAEHPITFIETLCRHHKGEWAGQPLLLEEWQKRIIRAVFGWKRADGTRRYRIAYIEVPRK